jgi:Synaptobrevin/Regulated-SNARE-like domain
MQSELDNIRYVAICRLHDRISVAEYCATDSLPKSRIIEKLQRVLRSDRVTEHKRLTITDRDLGCIHYDSDPACLYIVVCNKDYAQRLAFKFLGEVRRAFDEKYGDDVTTATESSLSRTVKPLLKEICAAHNRPRGGDKIASVALQVEAVKGQMNENIQSVLRNTENVEGTLVNQSDNMMNEGKTFNSGATSVRKRMWWGNQKIMATILILIIILIAVIAFPIVRNRSSAAGES